MHEVQNVLLCLPKRATIQDFPEAFEVRSAASRFGTSSVTVLAVMPDA